MNEDIANEQWGEDLESLVPVEPAEFVGPQQPMTPKEKAKKDRDQRQKVRAIRRTAVKVANKRRPIVSIVRPQVGATMEDFNSILDTFTRLADRLTRRSNIEISHIITARSLYKSLGKIYKKLGPADIIVLAGAYANAGSLMATISSRFTGTKGIVGRAGNSFKVARGMVKRTGDGIRNKLTATKNAAANTLIGRGVVGLSSALVKFTKKTSGFFGGMMTLARKPLNLLGGGGIFDMIGKGIGLAMLAATVLAPIVQGIDKALTQNFGPDYVKAAIKKVWDASWSFLVDQVKKFLGIDAQEQAAKRDDWEKRGTGIVPGSKESADQVKAEKDLQAARAAQKEAPSTENAAKVDAATAAASKQYSIGINSSITDRVAYIKGKMEDRRSTNPLRGLLGSIGAVNNNMQSVKDKLSKIDPGDVTKETRARLEPILNEAEILGSPEEKATAREIRALLARPKGSGAATISKTTESKVAGSTASPAGAPSSAAAPAFVNGGSVKVAPAGEPMETAGGVTAEQPPPPQEKPQASSGGSRGGHVAGGYTASSVPNNAVADGLLLLNAGVLA